MIAEIKPFSLKGSVCAPPSKSMAHRYLIGAALCGKECKISGVDYSEDILASIDCLRALGAGVDICNDSVTVDPRGFMKGKPSELFCRESGSTLRFFIPLALCTGERVDFSGSERLFERPLDVYEELCRENGFLFEKRKNSLSVCGKLDRDIYTVRGDVSSQFITGLIFALVYLKKDSKINILPPFESRSYVDLTVSALKSFGAEVGFDGDCCIKIKGRELRPYFGRVEGDYSNAAFLDAFNFIGSDVSVENLDPSSLQGDRVYHTYFEEINAGSPTLDISDCPDLGPVLFALSALKNGARFTGTDRLKAKESDRGMAMHEELSRLGGGLLFGDNEITVPKQELKPTKEALWGHNDHRIVMALSLILSRLGGAIDGAEAVRKSYPGYFDDIIKLGAKVEIK